jgi:hypothetical protein
MKRRGEPTAEACNSALNPDRMRRGRRRPQTVDRESARCLPAIAPMPIMHGPRSRASRRRFLRGRHGGSDLPVPPREVDCGLFAQNSPTRRSNQRPNAHYGLYRGVATRVTRPSSPRSCLLDWRHCFVCLLAQLSTELGVCGELAVVEPLVASAVVGKNAVLGGV